jgi:RNA polymerase sigma-70 factor, ECF subfamily
MTSVAASGGELEEARLLARARAGDGDAFGVLVGAYRGELHAHCYRMLGSYHDAEDALQDALVKAWRGLAGFEGRSSLRAWLYKVATSAALDVARHRSNRELPTSWGSSFPAGHAPGDVGAESACIEPYPGRVLAAGGWEPSPEARYEQQESLELAFIAAVQHLSPLQRAVLLLREVVGFSAQETADQLGTSVPAVTSALQRARVVDLVTADAVWAMPPLAGWYQGREAIGQFLTCYGFNERWRHVPTWANGQVALGCYTPDPDRGSYVASALAVVTLRGALIAEVDYFLTAELMRRWGHLGLFAGAEAFPRFGLPVELD